MRYKNDKNIEFVIRDSFYQAQNAPKSVLGRGSAPDPAGGAYNAPQSPDPLVGREGDTHSPFPSPLDAFSVSNSAPTAPRFSGPPQDKILTPVY